MSGGGGDGGGGERFFCFVRSIARAGVGESRCHARRRNIHGHLMNFATAIYNTVTKAGMPP